MLREREDMLKMLQFQLRRAQNRMKMQTDKHMTERSFHIGDMVFLKLQPYRQGSVAHALVQKLALKFYGLFRVIDKVGKVAY